MPPARAPMAASCSVRRGRLPRARACNRSRPRAARARTGRAPANASGFSGIARQSARTSRSLHSAPVPSSRPAAAASASASTEANELEYAAQIMLWAQLGVLTRILLRESLGAMCVRAGVFPDLPSNVLGCFIMGCAVHGVPAPVRSPLERLEARLARIHLRALNVGLRTGFCGSLTTFSNWMLVSSCFARQDPISAGVSAAALNLTLGTLLPISTFLLGSSIAWAATSLHGPRARPPPPPASVQQPAALGTAAAAAAWQPGVKDVAGTAAERSAKLREVAWQAPAAVATLALAVASGSAAAAWRAFCAGDFAGAALWMAPLFGIPGALIRWKMAALNRSWYNKDGKSMIVGGLPAGTFLANMAACAAAFLLTGLLEQPGMDATPAATAVIGAAIVGTLGALSTVSTWVAEIVALGKSGAWIKSGTYCVFSIVCAMSLSLLW